MGLEIFKKSCFFSMFLGGSLFAGYLYVPSNVGSTVAVVDVASNTQIATVTVGSSPQSIASTPNGLYSYVTNANNSSTSVSVINNSSNTVVATVTIGVSCSSLAITPDGNYCYVANPQGNNISVINTSNNTIIATVSGGDYPYDAAVTPDGNYVYVTNYNGNNVSVISTATNTVIATIGVGAGPSGVAITPVSGTYVYITNNSTSPGLISVINPSTNAIVATVTFGSSSYPFGIALTPDANYGYVTLQGSNRVNVFKTSDNSVQGTIPVGNLPRAIAMSANGKNVYVSNGLSNSLSVINTTTNTVTTTVSSIAAGANGPKLAIASPQQACIVDASGSNLFMIDEKALNLTAVSLSLGSSLVPKNIALTNDRMHAYITQSASNKISYVKMDYENIYPIKVASNITVGSNPQVLVLSPDGNYLYVADEDGTIYRIHTTDNATTAIASLIGGVPSNIGIDPTGQYLLVSLPLANEVVVISNPTAGSPTTNYVTVGSFPQGIAFDNSGNAYVPCRGSNNLYRIVLSSRTTSSLSLTGTYPSAISSMTISATSYFLIAMEGSNNVSLVNSSTFTETSAPSITNFSHQIVVNPNTPSVAYLIESYANAVQSIDFTSSTTSPTVSSQISTGTFPLGGACQIDGSKLYVLNYNQGSMSIFDLSGTNQRVLTANANSPITSLGAPEGISLCP